MRLLSTAGNGGDGGEAKGADQFTADGGGGGTGGTGGAISVNIVDGLMVSSPGIGILAQSAAGAGGTGAIANNDQDGSNNTSNGGRGGPGGRGGDVRISSSDDSDISISAGSLAGIVIQSVASNGGDGGQAEDAGNENTGGNGGAGGTGGEVILSLDKNNSQITVTGDQVQGILARSYGGIGGSGGVAGKDGDKGKGGASAGNGPGGTVGVGYRGGIVTEGDEANGIMVQSVGGFDGDPLSPNIVAYGTGAQSAGKGGFAYVNLYDGGGAEIQTSGDYSDGILVQSIGGGGGKVFLSESGIHLGSSGEAGGDGGPVGVKTLGAEDTIVTLGDFSAGINIQSIGGGGGDGGSSGVLTQVGGAGAKGGSGGTVTVDMVGDIITHGEDSYGIHAQSIGNGGGKAESVGGLTAIGASGGPGGNGGAVTVTGDGDISTDGRNADAIFAQSHGGSGGRGSNAVSTSTTYGLAIGGNGGGGGDGNSVSVNVGLGSSGHLIETTGDNARGVVAQSGGGGGGHGGNALTFTGSFTPSYSVAVGGSAGSGGEGGRVLVKMGSTAVTTRGNNAPAVFASSYGGGGGSAGTTLAVADSLTLSVTKTVGGSGGNGGRADTTQVCHGLGTNVGFCDGGVAAGDITTMGHGSHGIEATSIGGGGGHSGTTLSFSQGNFGNVQVTTGGSGGGGGYGEAVAVYSGGDITTDGQQAFGILAKSVGAGGGAAHFTGSATAFSTANVNVTVGGKGGDAGNASKVNVVSEGSIATHGSMSDGISAMSVGKSGGVGGITAAASGLTGLNVTVTHGGEGGKGATAGPVNVTWSGDTLETTADQSVGIYAASTGGSGGRGGLAVDAEVASFVGVQVNQGGGGGSGGVAGEVTVKTLGTGSLTTLGDFSTGISAVSQGGHGGHGGSTFNTAGGSLGRIDVNLGGDAGDAGTAAPVIVNNAVEIVTEGSNATGISATSHGGSGGTGGSVFDVGLSVPAEDDGSASVTVNIGGTGGSGGSADTVNVTNEGQITTKDFSSDAISAISHGGDGGRGGSVYTANINIKTDQTFQETLSFGGGGGSGSKADVVTVINDGNLATDSHDSYGILAQSLGGNGGRGGSSYSAVLNYKSQNQTSQSFTLNIGGKGGSGATGAAANVTNTGVIRTTGIGSIGILAQSVGGNGGAGGNGGTIVASGSSLTANQSSGYNLTGQFEIGGNGGTGMNAGPVTVTHTGNGRVVTSGPAAYGIQAQSTGGGGGNGGAASTMNLAVSGKCSITGANTLSTTCRQQNGASTQTSFSLDLNLGGKGGAAGNGELVKVSVGDASVQTYGQASHAIFAQSIGGGGGAGGSGETGISAFTTNKAANTIANIISDGTGDDPYTVLKSYRNWTIGIGGSGGGAGDGGPATIWNSGLLSTDAIASHGIFAQSVGGGGGSGGAAGSSLLWGITVGGSGKNGGTGGVVTVTNTTDATINTSGDGSYGILAQSVGGGGGESGLKKGGTILEFSSQAIVQVGGKTGANGNGGTVTIDNTDTTISTKGHDAVGIFAQSIGGGGGLAPGGFTKGTGTVTVAGNGSKGNGEAVKVTHSGSIQTGMNSKDANAASHGIVAQSIGGGGGYAGAVLVGSATNFGVNSSIGPGGNTTGNGGPVTVEATGPIVTQGASSMGIFAQSVGGGGGVQGVTDSSSTAAADAVKIGSAGGSGGSGAVKVTYNGSAQGGLATSGAGAHGIFAQSVGWAMQTNGGSAPVTVTVNGDVSATGAGAHGVLAQTAGANQGAVDIAIIEGATVTGGTEAAIEGAEDGSGIYVLNNTAANTILNDGAITSADGSSGIAVQFVGQGPGKLTVTNNGKITGKVVNAKVKVAGAAAGPAAPAAAPGPGDITLLNRLPGLVDAGPTLEVDSLTNRGTLAFGTGSIGNTALAGDLIQGSTGILTFEFDPSRTQAQDRTDQLGISGYATLDGRVRMSALDPWQPEPGRQSAPLIEAAMTIEEESLEVIPSVVAQYRLHRPTNSEIGVSYDIDFANRGILDATNDNQDGVARHVHGVYRGRALDEDVALALIAIEDSGDYAEVMNTLGGEIAVDNQITSLLSAIRFGDALLSCAERTDDYRYFDDGQCLWMRLAGERFERRTTDDNVGFDVNTWQIAGGGQVDLENGWLVGGAISYEEQSLQVSDSHASSDGGLLQAGVSLKRQIGATQVSGSVALGYGGFDIDRDPLPDVSIGGTQQQWMASGQLRVAHLIESGRWSLKPRIDLGVDYLSMDGFSETGDGGLGLRVDSTHQTYVHVQPAIDIATEITGENGVLYRPKLALGITQFLGDRNPTVTGRLAAAPDDVTSFRAASSLDKTRVDVAASLDVFARSNLVIRAGLSAGISENTRAYAGTLKIEMPF